MAPRTPLDDIEYLASSANRVAVLNRLAESATTRGELHEQTGITQPTLGRILEGFEERHWVVRDGRHYRTTRLGALLIEEFTSLLATVERVQETTDRNP